MLLAGALFVCWPLYRHQRRLTAGLALAAVFVLALSGVLYTQIGSPGVPSGPGARPDIDEMVGALAARLERNPEDVEGWKMLARSYLQLERYDDAIAAFEQALEREGGNQAQTLADLGEAVMMRQRGSVSGRPAQLFEAALVAAPVNPKALFYGGIAARERDDTALAAERWEALLALSPPPEIQDILRQRIAEWRGESAPAATAAPAAAGASSVTVQVSLSAAARAALGDDVTVFVIARDPAQPAPPVAAVRRTVGDLPAAITLRDADAMIPGRPLSGFESLEIVARASLSGQPLASPGDWYGSTLVEPGAAAEAAVEIGLEVE